MSSPAAQAVAQAVIEEVGKGRRPHLTKLAIKAGYSPESARSGKATKTKTYKAEVLPLVDRLEAERNAVIDRLKKTRSKAKYRDLIDGMDKITKTIQLLTGGATDNVNVVTVVKYADTTSVPV